MAWCLWLTVLHWASMFLLRNFTVNVLTRINTGRKEGRRKVGREAWREEKEGKGRKGKGEKKGREERNGNKRKGKGKDSPSLCGRLGT